MSTIRKTLLGLAAALVAATLLGGCASTTAQSGDFLAALSRDSAGR